MGARSLVAVATKPHLTVRAGAHGPCAGGTVYLFPGQGCQVPGMRERVQAMCPELLELVEDLVGCDPFAESERSTRLLQPAIFCASVAGWLRLRDLRNGPADAVALAGHSLGELAALVAAGAIDPEDGARLVVRRGELMERAANEGPPGGMMAVLGAPEPFVARLARVHNLTLATDNAPGEVVLTGPIAGLDGASSEALAAGHKAVRLPIRGAFHSQAMADIATAFAVAVLGANVRRPALPVYCSVTGRPFDELPRRLAQGLTHPVRWRQTLANLHAAGARRFVEVGPSSVLTGLVRRTLPGVEVSALDEWPGVWPAAHDTRKAVAA